MAVLSLSSHPPLTYVAALYPSSSEALDGCISIFPRRPEGSADSELVLGRDSVLLHDSEVFGVQGDRWGAGAQSLHLKWGHL